MSVITKSVKQKGNTMYDYTQDNLSIATSCVTCLALDTKCDECLEVSEARVSDLAHELVDEGSMQYPRLWLINRPQPSGHDWTESETVSYIQRDKNGEITSITYRHEFTDPIVQITDGGELDNLWELDDETQLARETVCQWCHILTPKLYNDCQSCDLPLESNVR